MPIKNKKKPKILLLPNIPNWAFDIRANIIIEYLKKYYDFDKMYSTFEMDKINKTDLNKYDLIFLFYWPDFLKIKQAINEHKLIIGVFSFRSWQNKKDELQKVSKNAKCLITNSRDLKKEIKNFHKKIFFAPNGIDDDTFKPHNTKEVKNKFIVGWMGDHTTKSKGLDDIIKPAINELDNVELKINNLPYNKQNEFYKMLDVYICLSQTETGPNPVFQAGACGVPVITTPVGEAKYFIQNMKNGLIIDRDIESLQKAILFLKNNPTILNEMSKQIRKDIEKNWSWKKLIKKYQLIFKKCLKNN